MSGLLSVSLEEAIETFADLEISSRNCKKERRAKKPTAKCPAAVYINTRVLKGLG